MKNYFISCNNNAFRWREFPAYGWSNFTDGCLDVQGIKSYLTLGGTLNDVSLSFVTPDNKPANIFQVKKTKSGKFEVILNAGERRFTLHDFEFFPIDEAIRFFYDKVDPEVNDHATNLKGLEAVQYYQEHSDNNTKAEYDQIVKSRMDEAGIRNHLKNYEPGKAAEVYFLKEAE
jgi:hypothetical protein